MRTRQSGPLLRLLIAVLAAGAATLALATPASAAAPENGWTCRGQSLTASIGGQSPLQGVTNLLAAGGEFEPCATNVNSPAASTLKPLTDALALLGVKVGVVQADTTADTTQPTRDQLPTAHAKVADVDVSLAGMQLVHVDTAESRVSAKCVGNTPEVSSTFDVGAVTILGQAIDLDDPVTQVSRGIAGLDIIIRVTPGGQTIDPTFGHTRRALRIEVIQTVLGFQASLLDLGVGVSNVTVKGAPCAAAATPTVGIPTVDGRTLTSIVDPPAGTTISSCSFAVTPTAGAAQTVVGIYDPTSKACTAVLLPSAFPAGTYTSTATATTSAGGAGTSAASPPFVLAAPTATAPTVGAPGVSGRTVSSTVAAATGTTIAACRFVVTPAGASPVAVAGTFADGRCAADLPRASFPPGEYTITAAATSSDGQVGEATGPASIAGPTVGAPIAVGPLVGAPVTPGPGATVTSCTVTVTPAAGGAAQTLPGTYDQPTGGCAALLDAARFPSGDYDVVVEVVDSGGDKAAKAGRVTVGQFGVITVPPGSGAATPGPPSTADVAQALLACEAGRKVTLTDVRLSGSRVGLEGVAQKTLAGQTVLIRFTAKGRSAATVARVKVGKDGLFSTSATAPAKRFRTSKANGRYTASIAGSTSSATKLSRRMVFTTTRLDRTTIRVSGRVTAPLPRSGQVVTVTRRVTCSKYQTVVKTKTTRKGTFTATFKAPADGSAGVYRAGTKVPTRKGGPARVGTFTLPRIIAGR
jgi:hypothetical protein